jgi:hypothetical protein
VFRTEKVDGELLLRGRRLVAADRFVDERGREEWLLHLPSRRVWSPAGALVDTRRVGHVVSQSEAGVQLRVDEPCEIDVMELGEGEAVAARSDRREAMTVIGSFAPLAGPADLGRFLVGSTILDTTDFGGRRCPSEQTALSIYRIARARGGTFWDAVAKAIGDLVARRVTDAPGGLPVHDLLGAGETHTRFVADAVLLLLADGRAEAVASALDGLDAMSVPWGDGRWYLHDTLERDTPRNDLVLNTHVHAVVAASAAGSDVAPPLTALDAVLSLRGERAPGAVFAAMLAVSDRLRARGRGHGLAHRAQHMAARARARSPHLRLPGGWLARDVTSHPAPSYFTVNLSDLAVLDRVRPTAASVAALRAALRYARVSGHFAAQRRDRDPLAVLVPSLLRNAGLLEAARRAADATVAAGWAPAIGWPGHEDHLWDDLPAGTP